MTQIEVKRKSNVPNKNLDFLEEGQTLAIYDKGYDTPFKGTIHRLTKNKVYITFHEPPPVTTPFIEKDRIKKIYKIDIMSGSLTDMVFLDPESYFGE